MAINDHGFSGSVSAGNYDTRLSETILPQIIIAIRSNLGINQFWYEPWLAFCINTFSISFKNTVCFKSFKDLKVLVSDADNRGGYGLHFWVHLFEFCKLIFKFV